MPEGYGSYNIPLPTNLVNSIRAGSGALRVGDIGLIQGSGIVITDNGDGTFTFANSSPGGGGVAAIRDADSGTSFGGTVSIGSSGIISLADTASGFTIGTTGNIVQSIDGIQGNINLDRETPTQYPQITVRPTGPNLLLGLSEQMRWGMGTYPAGASSHAQVYTIGGDFPTAVDSVVITCIFAAAGAGHGPTYIGTLGSAPSTHQFTVSIFDSQTGAFPLSDTDFSYVAFGR